MLLAVDQVEGEAHLVGVVCNHQPVQRARELDRDPGRGDQLLAAGESVGAPRIQPRAEDAGVEREAGVQVGVPPVGLAREAASRIGRVRLALVRIGQHGLRVGWRRNLSHRGLDHEQANKNGVNNNKY